MVGIQLYYRGKIYGDIPQDIVNKYDVFEGKRGTYIKMDYDPDKVNDVIARLGDPSSVKAVVHEDGEGLTNTGRASIICGMKGEAMKPYYKNKNFAEFALRACYVIDVGRHRDVYNIIVSKVWVDGVSIHWKTVWKYKGNDHSQCIPMRLEFLSDAIDAAVGKSRHYHCRCLHYVSD